MAFDRRNDDKDAFWDLEALLPARKNVPNAKSFATRIQPADVIAEPSRPTDAAQPVGSMPQVELRLTASPDEGCEVIEYQPVGNNLILSVRVIKRTAEYNFYGQFRRDAAKYLREEGEPCAYVPFFSYIPQYSQLTAAQRQYYFFWRDSLRQGEYPKIDESYFYLYVYEIVNLPDLIPPEEGLEMLCNVWSAYRKALPRIDKYMTEWIADYCLVHGLACPSERLRPFLAKILPLATMREFYLGAMGDYTPRGVDTALAFFSDYRWQESRYAAGETYPLFETHILAAMSSVLAYLFEKEKTLLREVARTLRRRDAFCGSLCAHNIRCRLEVTYHSVRDASYLRTCITAAVKYAENKLRSLLAVKSRLSVHLPQQAVADLIDRYFSAVADRIRTSGKEEQIPEYEHLYDAPACGVDLARAQEIERVSWDTTKALVSEEELEEIEKNEISLKADQNFAIPSSAAQDVATLTEEEVAYLSLLWEGDTTGARAFLLAQGRIEEELTAAINEKSLARIGDVIVESDGVGYRIVEDYAEEVSEWIG